MMSKVKLKIYSWRQILSILDRRVDTMYHARRRVLLILVLLRKPIYRPPLPVYKH